MDAPDVVGLLASLRERALELEDAVATVRPRDGRGWGAAQRGARAGVTMGIGLTQPGRLSPPSPPPLLQDEAGRLAAWTAEKPDLKAFIGALVESRALLRRELRRLEGGGAPPPPPEAVAGGAVTGFNVMR